jgi:hypothetical protein
VVRAVSTGFARTVPSTWTLMVGSVGILLVHGS